VKLPTFSTALFYVSAVPFTVALALVALSAHSEIPADRMWDMLERPTCVNMILSGLSATGMLVAGTIQAVSAERRPNNPRRRLAVIGAALLAVAALFGLFFASCGANALTCAGNLWNCLGSSAYPGVVKILSFQYHPATLVDGESWEAWIEFRAGSTDAFTDTLHPAAQGDETEALRVARETFQHFRPAPDGAVHCIRAESGFEGWIVPGESSSRCVVIAWRSTTP
jgi:F0F1-type ATP synthase membrane subunit c/vacuolar-type H+-ATPase subunit K